MKVTALIYVSYYKVSQLVKLFHFDYTFYPKDSRDQWIVNTLGEYDQAILAKLDDADQFTVIYDKDRGWINGFEHFNENTEEESNENMSTAGDSI